MSGNSNGRKWLIPLVPVIILALVTAVALGQQLQITEDHDRRIENTEQTVRNLETNQATILERVNQAKDLGDDNKALLIRILRTLRPVSLNKEYRDERF